MKFHHAVDMHLVGVLGGYDLELVRHESDSHFLSSEFIGSGLSVSIVAERDTAFSIHFISLSLNRDKMRRLSLEELDSSVTLNEVCAMKGHDPVYASFRTEDWEPTMKKVAETLPDVAADILRRDFSDCHRIVNARVSEDKRGM